MNYIRGAVSAISAPYQYYKDLNPSTLTGAIDVIVIQRPTETGDTELVCSPFHVRFGKWQVLRPFEKKVNVSVNGNPIPFNMKIGEAGEAFFVFETDDDVPPDLITSPIIQPTIPEEKKQTNEIAQVDPSEQVDERKLGDTAKTEEAQRPIDHVEPDFLDLDGNSNARDDDFSEDVRTTPKQTNFVPKALRKSTSRTTISQKSVLSLSSPPLSGDHSREQGHPPEMNEQDRRVDDALQELNREAHLPEVEYHHDIALDMEGYKQGYHDRERSDETVGTSSGAIPFPNHRSPPSHLSHTQSASHSPHVHSPYPSPPLSGSVSPSTSPLTSSHSHPYPFRATSEPPPDLEAHIDHDIDPTPPPMPTLSSNPSQLKLAVPMTQEYSWEWGGFPTPSPVKASFGKGGRVERMENVGTGMVKAVWDPSPLANSTTSDERVGRSIGRLGGRSLPSMSFDIHGDEDGSQERSTSRSASTMSRNPNFAGRSKSVPPQLEATLENEGRRGSREYKEYEDLHSTREEGDEELRIEEFPKPDGANDNGSTKALHDQENVLFGEGGVLSASADDPNVFVLSIDGRKVAFQLSLVPREGGESIHLKQHRESKADYGGDEVEAARLFDGSLVSVDRFLEDRNVVEDDRLVIRWADDQYVTRNDGSPLMGALVHWRSLTLVRRSSGLDLRPVSPPSLELASSLPSTPPQEKQGQDQRTATHTRSKSESPNAAEMRKTQEADTTLAIGQNGSAAIPNKPTSLSWVQWWSRSRRKESTGLNGKSNLTNGYGPLDPAKDRSSVSLPLIPSSRGAPQADGGQKKAAESVPSTPVQRAVDAQVSKNDETTPTKPATSQRTELPPARTKRYAKTLRLTSDQLKSLNLRPGANSITFSLSASGAVAATARIFVWDSTDLVVVSDIDGTITKSDGLGHVFAMIGRDWTHVGVAKLYTDITRNGYKIMYLTSRAIGQADSTRDYLKGIKQNDHQIPEGPVIMSPDRLMASLHREVIMRKPEVFKMACLRDIQRLFGESARNPFYAGFGNRITDALSYRSVNVPSARIFTIDSTGEVKMELLELAGYKSSYIHMTDLVDQMFPPIHKKWTPEFTDFNYWKTPVLEFPLPDLSPPSPALSARSDTSNQSALARLRNFSLGGGGPANRNRQHLQPSLADGSISEAASGDAYRSSHLKQISSLEKLSSTLGFMSGARNGDAVRESTSPESTSSYASSDDDEDGSEAGDGRPRKRTRRRSMTSMPGTLDETHFDLDDEDEGEDGEHDHGGQFDRGEDEGEEEYEDEDGGIQLEEEFDEDLLAAGEMKSVPYL